MSNKFNINSPLVTVFGGSGFLGRYIVRRMVKAGWRVRVAVKNPNEALFLKTNGEVGQVELLQADILNERLVKLAVEGANSVVNCVAGDLYETKLREFKKFYVTGPALLAKVSQDAGVKKFIHMSAISADLTSKSMYGRSKARGEEEVVRFFPKAFIIRPSIVFGSEDRFFNMFASMARYSPIVPVIGGNSLFQPIYVDDVSKVVSKVIQETFEPGIYEIGGPEIFSFVGLMEKMLLVVRRKRIVLSIPLNFAKIMAFTFSILKSLTFGLFKAKITLDNIEQLRRNNIVSKEQKTIEKLEINTKTLDMILPTYLFSYRPYGQYSDITNSSED